MQMPAFEAAAADPATPARIPAPWSNPRILKQLRAAAGRGRDCSQPYWDHARYIGSGLREAHPGPQSRDAQLAEISEEDFIAIELEGQDQR